jgi:hypothetical protein
MSELSISLSREEAEALLRTEEFNDQDQNAGLAEATALNKIRAALLDAQEVQPQALEPVGEEPCDCDPDMRIASDCDRLGCREARKSGAVQIERQPEEKCIKCGAPRGTDHDNACPTGSWKVLESQCQPEDEINAAAIRDQARAIRDHLATVEFDNDGLPPVSEIAGALVVYAATQRQPEDERPPLGVVEAARILSEPERQPRQPEDERESTEEAARFTLTQVRELLSLRDVAVDFARRRWDALGRDEDFDDIGFARYNEGVKSATADLVLVADCLATQSEQSHTEEGK